MARSRVLRHRVAVALAAAVLGGLLAPGAADAALRDGADPAAMARVVRALERGSQVHELSPADRRVLQEQLMVAEEVAVTTEVVPDDDRARAVAATSGADADLVTVSALASGCWIKRVIGKASALAGNVLYTYFVEGRWCASGSTVTSVRHEYSYGETGTPGWSYHGVQSQSAGVRSNEGRTYAKHKFVLKAGFVTVQTTYPCIRLRGRPGGAWASDLACSLA